MSGYLDTVIGPWLEDEVMLMVYLTGSMTALFAVGATALSQMGFSKEDQIKKRAWIITGFSSGCCFLLGVYACNEQPIHWDFSLRARLMGESNLSRFVVHFFRVQAVLDLALGVLFYRSELYFLTSIVHHIAYFLLCNWMLRNACSLMFIICCLEELPTFFLALGHLNKAWRTDMGFGCTYGLLRVLLHTFLCYTVFAYPEPDERLLTMRFNFGLTWSLHTYWFYGWVQQQRRMLREKRSLNRAASPEEERGLRSPKSPKLGYDIVVNAGGSRSSSKSSTGSLVKSRI